MKKIVFTVLAASALMCAGAADSAWLTNLPKAAAQAKAESKLVLLDFGGSDWCTGCIELKKKVFDSAKFQAYAATNVVLVDVDFPEKKPLPDALKKANDALVNKFKVEGYPTLIVLDSNGKEIGRMDGYEGIGPDAFITALNEYKSTYNSKK